jgi:hypothetical protein
MRFDWQRFCTRNKISFVTHGPNVAQGHLGIKCPWCGSADKSEHMGLKLDVRDPVWGCFRNAAHRGRNPTRLIARLLNIGFASAARMVEAELINVDDMEGAVAAMQHEAAPGPVGRPALAAIPEEFRPLGRQPENSYESRFLAYLSGRGFGDSGDAAALAEAYGLWYALTGEQAWRVIFPVMDEANKLLGWTGRDIRHGATLRYKASPGLGKDVLLTFPEYPGTPMSEVLVICEGPVDALKIDAYGSGFGIKAVATMGTAFTVGQIAQLARLAKRHRKTWAIFDQDALAQNLYLTDQVPGAQWYKLPDGIKDPGELTSAAATMLCEELTQTG